MTLRTTALTGTLTLALAACGDSPSATYEASSAAGEPVGLERGAPIDAPAEATAEEPGEALPAAPEAPSSDDLGRAGSAIQKVAGDLAAQGDLDTAAIGAIDASKKAAAESGDGFTPITWRDLSMQDLPMDDILDALLYPEEYEEGEFEFPERISKHDGQDIAIVGYMIPLEWKETTVPAFMLVRDLLGCCFGGSPMPDEWIDVTMVEGGAEYYPYVPVVVKGRLRIEGIEDEAGYAAGCFHIDGVTVAKDR